VGNLPYQTTEQDLRDMFGQAGEIAEVAIISDRYTGQSKGFAFVEMSTDEGAQQAIAQFDGTDIGGRNIVVNEARPREDSPRGGGGRGGYGGGGGRGGYGGGRDRDRRDDGGRRDRY
jgi:RNA recognition motif-containing protein